MTKKDITQEIKQQIINDYVVNLMSIRDLCHKYGIKSHSCVADILKGNTRSLSESLKVRAITKPLEHSKETKELMREKRLRYLASNKNGTAWHNRNNGIMSQAEQAFEQILNNIDKKYNIVKELSLYPYFADFAFVDIKLDVEIDGAIHKQKDRALSDIRKDEYLKSLGWTVVRFTNDDVLQNKDCVANRIIEILNSFIVVDDVTIHGITKYHSQNKTKVPRDKNGYSEKEKAMFFRNRKVKDRPTKNELLELLKNNSKTQVGKLYGVSATTIRKWLARYNKQENIC